MENQKTISPEMQEIENKIKANDKRFARINLLLAISQALLIMCVFMWPTLCPIPLIINVLCGLVTLSVLIWFIYLLRTIKFVTKESYGLYLSKATLLSQEMMLENEELISKIILSNEELIKSLKANKE